MRISHLNFVMIPSVIAHIFLWIFAIIISTGIELFVRTNNLWLERAYSLCFAWIHQTSSRPWCLGFATPPTCPFFNQLEWRRKPRVHMWGEDTRYVMQKKDRASCSWCAGGGRGIDPRRACTRCGHSLFSSGSGAWYLLLLLLLHSHIISTCPLPTSCHPLGLWPLRNRYSQTFPHFLRDFKDKSFRRYLDAVVNSGCAW